MKKYLLIVFVFSMSIFITADPVTDGRERRIGSRYTAFYTATIPSNDTTANGDTVLTDTGGLTFNGGDYTFRDVMHGVLLGPGSGDLKFKLKYGGEIHLRALSVDSTILEIRGYLIESIDSAATTFNGPIWPLW